jgi:hypothetical protein
LLERLPVSWEILRFAQDDQPSQERTTCLRHGLQKCAETTASEPLALQDTLRTRTKKSRRVGAHGLQQDGRRAWD